MSRRRRFKDDQGQRVDEIMEIELVRETRLAAESQLQERLNSFQDSLGVNLSKEAQKEAPESSKPSHLSLDNA